LASPEIAGAKRQLIPTFTGVVRRPHHIDTHKEIDDVLDRLVMPSIERGPSRSSPARPRSRSRPSAIGNSSERPPRAGPISRIGTPGRELSTANPKLPLADFISDNGFRPGTSTRHSFETWRSAGPTPRAEDYAAHFRHRLDTISDDYPPELVFNIDESWSGFFGATGQIGESHPPSSTHRRIGSVDRV
jgi:hypothetical protein